MNAELTTCAVCRPRSSDDLVELRECNLHRLPRPAALPTVEKQAEAAEQAGDPYREQARVPPRPIKCLVLPSDMGDGEHFTVYRLDSSSDRANAAEAFECWLHAIGTGEIGSSNGDVGVKIQTFLESTLEALESI